MRKANYCDGPKNNDKRNDWWEPLTLAMDDMYRVHNEFTQEQMVAFQKEASSLFPSDLPSQLINQDSQPTIKSPTSAPGLAESESPAVMDSAQQDSPTRKLESVSTDLTLDFPSSGEPLPTETLPMDEENLRAISKKLTDLARLQELESAAAAVAASASSPASALTTHDSVFDTMTLSTNPPPPATHLLDDSGSTANDAIVTPSESTTSSQPAFNVWIHRKPKYRKKLLVSFFYYCLAHASSLDPVHPSFATTQPSPHPPLLADPAAVLSADALIPLPTPELASNDRLEPSSDAQLE
ncbi:hypothetical protein DM01DRAFT_1331834 [Hesseltinella vesiculosa]|uniref:Uncharacterized protein n=1 Tax=Hesseltinella vesiculosa TaxID=101127 RepID=A0A1X2GXT2_9FUNG|nr:hypothetical protein DM01DRAFT_1331834 [Hesseltinella vesiculosa]